MTQSNIQSAPTTAPGQPHDPQLSMVLGQLITNEVQDTRILNAMVSVPRSEFVPTRLANAACVDEDLAIGNGRFILSPLTLARLVQLANITLADKVLDIGCNYGYSTAVLAQLAGKITACETQAEMVEHTNRLLQQHQLANARAVQVTSLADGYNGDAPYDVIFLNGAIDRLPAQIFTLLRDGGRLVAVERKRGYNGLTDGPGMLVEYTRSGTQPVRRTTWDASAPLLPGFALQKGFIF